MRAAMLIVVWCAGCGRVGFDPFGETRDAPAGAEADAEPDAATPLRLYASTYTTLYRFDLSTYEPTVVFDLCLNVPGFPPIADISVESTGTLLVGTQLGHLYRADLATGMCTALTTTLGFEPFALEIIPRGQFDPTADAVFAGGNDNQLYRIDPVSGVPALIGPIGAVTSGDAAWTGSELIMSVEGGSGDDLGRINLGTGASARIGGTGLRIYGLVALPGKLIGFALSGEVVSLDPVTAAPTVLQAAGTLTWTGAAASL